MGDAAAVAERADLDLAQRRAGLQLHRRVVHKQGSRDPMRGFQPSGAAPPWLALRISRTVFSALSGTRLLACLIVAPQRGYDEPAILSYAISLFCPISADGLQLVYCAVLALLAGVMALLF